jgi:hypothetical protein
MKRTLLLVAALMIVATMSEAQFRQKVITKQVFAPRGQRVTAAETTYVGTFSAYLGFLAFYGTNLPTFYDGVINVRRGFEDGSYLNIFLTLPEEINDNQVYGLAYGKMLSQPMEATWLFLNAGTLFSKSNDPARRNYIGIPVGIEVKYDFTDFAAIALRADVMPAYDFHEFGLAAIGQASLSISP